MSIARAPGRPLRRCCPSRESGAVSCSAGVAKSPGAFGSGNAVGESGDSPPLSGSVGGGLAIKLREKLTASQKGVKAKRKDHSAVRKRTDAASKTHDRSVP